MSLIEVRCFEVEMSPATVSEFGSASCFIIIPTADYRLPKALTNST